MQRKICALTNLNICQMHSLVCILLNQRSVVINSHQAEGINFLINPYEWINDKRKSQDLLHCTMRISSDLEISLARRE